MVVLCRVGLNAEWEEARRGLLDFVGAELCVDDGPDHVVALHCVERDSNVETLIEIRDGQIFRIRLFVHVPITSYRSL